MESSKNNVDDRCQNSTPAMTVEGWLGGEELPITIWKNKYRLNEESFEQWLNRVSGGNNDVKELIREKKFIFAGRILSNRGVTDRNVSYSNCYVLPNPSDSLESIFETGSQLARTFSYGGGCGIDISTLRPKGAPVNNAARTTSGAVSFMDFFSYITGLIGQNGRRGALMISLSCEHPDLVDFINLKSNLDVCTKANISVRVTDEFMRAVESDGDFTLHFEMEDGSTIEEVVKAREVFMLLAKRNWEMAEPGILYWDRISNYNLLQDTGFEYAGVNPCAEESLPAGGSCLLGSINLSEFVLFPHTSRAHVDESRLLDAVEIAVIGLNEVLMEGLKMHPLQVQRESVCNWRQIGLGTLGLADMLIKLGLKYGSKESLAVIEKVYRIIATKAILTSLDLAKKHGAFPKCTTEIKQAIVTSDFIKNLNLPINVLDSIQRHGLYNSQILTCAPTGTIGTMLQVSTGVEPNFAFSYNRRTVSLNDEEKTYKVDARIVKEFKEAVGSDTLPDYFVSSADINYHDRITVQSILQRYIDASISSTVNLPHETTVEEVADLYMQAWKQGLKGITIWRDGCQRAGILSVDKKKESEDVEKNAVAETPRYNSITPTSRKDIGITTGATFCKKCACGTLYVTVNKDSSGNIVEIFTHTSKGGICAANTNGLTRMISLAMRSGVSITEIKDQLRGINCPACLKLKAQGKAIDGISCPDILSKTIEEFEMMGATSPLSSASPVQKSDVKTDVATCPECGAPIEHQSGCRSCSSCGWSKCG